MRCHVGPPKLQVETLDILSSKLKRFSLKQMSLETEGGVLETRKHRESQFFYKHCQHFWPVPETTRSQKKL